MHVRLSRIDVENAPHAFDEPVEGLSRGSRHEVDGVAAEVDALLAVDGDASASSDFQVSVDIPARGAGAVDDADDPVPVPGPSDDEQGVALSRQIALGEGHGDGDLFARRKPYHRARSSRDDAGRAEEGRGLQELGDGCVHGSLVGRIRDYIALDPG